MQQLTLSDAWQLKQRDPAHTLDEDFASSTGWTSASVPGCVHTDLLAVGVIPDPFIGLNENTLQWIGERDWLYRCVFEVPADLVTVTQIDLCCDGLDTFATMWLNGAQVLSSDNMFVPQRVAVKQVLHPGRNELRIQFESALRRGKEREAQYGPLRVWNGDNSRAYVRKAQYHYGWDWGPCLMTAGPWQPVRLEAYDARITDLHCPTNVAADLRHATLPVNVTVAGEGTSSMHLELRGPNGEPVSEATVTVTNGIAQHMFELDTPQLWWPNGHGAQPLYSLSASLQSSSSVSAALDSRTLRLGLRRLELIQEPVAGEPGTSFMFAVNNMPLFSGGANWIPADSFTTRIPPERYRELLQLAADGNMTMLRVWGGGIYEEDCFYDLCDELGLLVWQDFMFACGIYPALDWFQASVRVEAEAALRRLRHHPSIALWCGNNEDYQVAESINVYDSAFEGDFTTTGFPAREIYERLLPDVCATLDPTRSYWPGSPYSDGTKTTDPTVGDRHTWEIWHGPVAPYNAYPNYAGRFVSEFGMEAAPAMATIEAFAPVEERYHQSRTLDHHNKSSDGARRLAMYLNDTLRMGDSLEAYVYGTQLVQAEALAAGVRGWRRRWAGPGRYAVAGALVWQLDDCWPVTSWAMIDYFLRPKPSYYTVRRELAPLAVGVARTTSGGEAWVVNATGATIEAEIVWGGWRLDGSERLRGRVNVRLAPHSVTELGGAATSDEQIVYVVQLIVHGAVVSRATLWPEPFKYLHLPDPSITIERLDGEQLRVSAQRPAKGVWLAAGDTVAWSDNMLDLLPGDAQIITARGLGDSQIDVRWLRQG